MAKPGIVTIDDDVNVLRAVQSDLRKKYGADYRISSADSGEKALELLTNLTILPQRDYEVLNC